MLMIICLVSEALRADRTFQKIIATVRYQMIRNSAAYASHRKKKLLLYECSL